MSTGTVVGIAGNITRPSRTSALVSAILAEISLRSQLPSRLIELVDIGSELFQAIVPEHFDSFFSHRISANVRAVIRAIETADALIVGTPVYKGSYTGALKHLFDLIPPNALAGKPVLLAATAGSPLHGLVTEHQLRPLFGFFNARTVATTVFALERDFQNYQVETAELVARIKRAAAELAEWLPAAQPSAALATA
jgi:FMN reductase